MRENIVFLGSLNNAELAEISNFLSTECSQLGRWAKFTRQDSPFSFAVCSNGKHFIRLAGYNIDGLRYYKTKEVKTFVNTWGYIGVSGFSTMHQLVAEAFMSDFVPYPEKEVNHLDGNKQNNDISNLELVTHKENINHFFTDSRMEEHRQIWLTNHQGRKWSEDQRRKFMTNCPHTSLSSESRAKISAAHRGKKLSATHVAKLKAVNTGNKYALGKICVTDGTHNKVIYPNQLPELEQLGYVRGRVIHNIPKHKAPYVHTKEFLEKQHLRKLSKEAS